MGGLNAVSAVVRQMVPLRTTGAFDLLAWLEREKRQIVVRSLQEYAVGDRIMVVGRENRWALAESVT